MSFEVFFLYLYSLLQLYLVSFRSTVTARALAFLVLVGMLACAPAAIAGEYLIAAYVPSSPLQVVLFATMEELAKAAPVIYLLYLSRVGASASLLDGVLYGAATGTGFALAEDLLYTLEHVALPPSFPSGGILSALGTWLPGGWFNGSDWFPGHLVLTALVAAFLVLGRRLWVSKIVRGIALILGLLVGGFLHTSFNNPPPTEPASVSSFLYYQVAGRGVYVQYLLLGVVILLIILQERVIRAKAPAELVPGAPDLAQNKSIFTDLSGLVERLGQGWASLQQLRRIMRWKTELTDIHWEKAHLRGKDDSVFDPTMAYLQAEIRNQLAPTAGQPGSKSLSHFHFLSLNGMTLGGKVYRIASLPVLVFGFGVVFLTPFFAHADMQKTLGSTPALLLGGLAQVLLVWRLIYYVKRKVRVPEAMDSSEAISGHCRTILTWSGALVALSAWKQLYDTGALPYPLQRGAQIKEAHDQLQRCIGPPGATQSTYGPPFGPNHWINGGPFDPLKVQPPPEKRRQPGADKPKDKDQDYGEDKFGKGQLGPARKDQPGPDSDATKPKDSEKITAEGGDSVFGADRADSSTGPQDSSSPQTPTGTIAATGPDNSTAQPQAGAGNPTVTDGDGLPPPPQPAVGTTATGGSVSSLPKGADDPDGIPQHELPLPPSQRGGGTT